MGVAGSLRMVIMRVPPAMVRVPVPQPVVVMAAVVAIPVAAVVGVPMMPPVVAGNGRMLAAVPLRRGIMRCRRRIAHGAARGRSRGRGRRHVRDGGVHV